MGLPGASDPIAKASEQTQALVSLMRACVRRENSILTACFQWLKPNHAVGVQALACRHTVTRRVSEGTPIPPRLRVGLVSSAGREFKLQPLIRHRSAWPRVADSAARWCGPKRMPHC